MLFSSSNFLLPNNPSDRVLQIQTSTSDLVGGFSVCNMQKAMTEANVLWINLGKNVMMLEFANGGDARLALNLLQTLVDSLVLNCVLGGSPDKNYVHTQVAASTTWTIIHNLGKIPAITILDTNNEQVIADVALDGVFPLDKVIITFKESISGKAIFN